jgi:hypothetical protein
VLGYFILCVIDIFIEHECSAGHTFKWPFCLQQGTKVTV